MSRSHIIIQLIVGFVLLLHTTQAAVATLSHYPNHKISSSSMLRAHQAKNKLERDENSKIPFFSNNAAVQQVAPLTTFDASNILQTSFLSVSMSSSGQYIAALGIDGVYVSSDNGQSYTIATTPIVTTSTKTIQNGAIAVASTSPQYMLFGCNLGLYASSNYGLTFSSPSIMNLVSNNYFLMTISGNGQHAYVGNAGETALLVSHDNLKTFQQKFPKLPNQDMAIAIYDIALSSDASTLYVMSLARMFMGSMATDVWTELHPNTINIYPFFSSISTNTNGQYVSLIGDGLLYVSKKYGKKGTWRTHAKSACTQLQRVAMSPSGQDVYASANGYMCHTSDFGVHTLKVPAPPVIYKALAVDGTGASVVGASQEGSLFKSTDNGNTWSPRNYDWVDLVMSRDGQTTVALSGYSNNGFVAMSTNNGATWLQAGYDSLRSYTSIACDATCQYMALTFGSSQFLVVSNDFGKTWRQMKIRQGTSWDGPSLLPLAVSSSGQYMSIGQYKADSSSSGIIYTSSDYGMNWKPAKDCPHQNWVSLAMSSSGKIQLAGPSGQTLHLSIDYGVTWKSIISTTLPSIGIWVSVASDSNGQNLVAVATFSGTAMAKVYFSNDIGSTWKLAALPDAAWHSCTISSNGKTMYVASSTGIVYSSTDSGATWNQLRNVPMKRYSKIACDSNGKQLTLVAMSGPVYQSSDSGMTWKEQNIVFSLQNDFGVTLTELDSIVGNYSGSYVVFVIILLFMAWCYRQLVNDKARSEKKDGGH